MQEWGGGQSDCTASEAAESRASAALARVFPPTVWPFHLTLVKIKSCNPQSEMFKFYCFVQQHINMVLDVFMHLSFDHLSPSEPLQHLHSGISSLLPLLVSLPAPCSRL